MTRKELFDWVKNEYAIEPDCPWPDFLIMNLMLNFRAIC